MLNVLLLVILFAFAAGCSVGPDYHRPTAIPGSPVPEKFGDVSITNAVQWKVAEPSAWLPRSGWWLIYNDAELNRLETLAATNNQQVAAAVANFDQARAAVTSARSSFYPQISADPSYARQRTSANQSPTANLLGGTGRTYNQFVAPLDASWEIDIWGRIRRQSQSASAQLAVSADDLESARLTVQAEVASDYFNLRTLDDQSALLTRAADAYQHALKLTQDRKRAGVADEQDVAEAEAQFRSARAQIQATDLQRAQTRHALAVLCGQPATTFALTPNTMEQTNLPAIPIAVPSEWLEHRPDVSAAERQMAAANAQIGVATAAFYPRVMLTGSAGYESISASSLFDWPSHLWAVGPSITFPLFTGGQNVAQLRSAQAAYNGAVANYRQTVLAAFQDVEDQLAGETYLAGQLDETTAAYESAKRALDIVTQRYKAGVEVYLDVITSQTTELAQEESVNQLRGQRLANSVSLIKALGAGWTGQPSKP
jgi:NodT family efflux transporter outer membrane factor (OMF) lipoprotein